MTAKNLTIYCRSQDLPGELAHKNKDVDAYLKEHHKYVYVASFCEREGIKVGCSKNPAQRLRNIETGLGLTVAAAFVTRHSSGALYAESKILRNFRQYSLVGEWVNAAFFDVAEFASAVSLPEDLPEKDMAIAYRKQLPGMLNFLPASHAAAPSHKTD